MIDPLSAFVFATLFALLNGGVLGFMHRALSPELQPSAADWRVGTLLMAGGSVLFIAQSATETRFVIPIANGFWLMGLALYWRAVRRYFAAPDSVWIFAPVWVGTAGISFFTFVVPSLAQRINVATVCWALLLSGSAVTLLRHRQSERSISGKVLSGIFILLAVLILLRGAFYLTQSTVMISIASSVNMVNALTPLLLAVLPVVGTTAFVLLCFERIRRDLHRVATTDALTGLPNRLTINERALTLFGDTARQPENRRNFAIAIIDIDHFKSINDRYGHDAGDIVLQGVAKTLAAHSGDGNLVGRQGGEEFVALLDGADRGSAIAVAERLRAQVERSSYQAGATPLEVTVSIGVAYFDEHDCEFADILRRADRALYAAKDEGRNCVRFDAVLIAT